MDLQKKIILIFKKIFVLKLFKISKNQCTSGLNRDIKFLMAGKCKLEKKQTVMCVI